MTTNIIWVGFSTSILALMTRICGETFQSLSILFRCGRPALWIVDRYCAPLLISGRFRGWAHLPVEKGPAWKSTRADIPARENYQLLSGIVVPRPITFVTLPKRRRFAERGPVRVLQRHRQSAAAGHVFAYLPGSEKTGHFRREKGYASKCRGHRRVRGQHRHRGDRPGRGRLFGSVSPRG